MNQVVEASLPPEALLAALEGRRRGTLQRGTHRMQVLCHALGDPHLALPAVHVVGTDGKTSTARMISALLAAAGVRSGETTSPHLEQPEERLRVAGKPVDGAVLTAAGVALQHALPVVERQLGESATFFEAVTALALRSFVDAQVEVAVVEAGIGGAGDASNVVDSQVTVVTPVGTDHTELGPDVATIAREKATVVTPGGVIVSGPQQPPAAAAIATVAAERRARLVRIGVDAGVQRRRAGTDGQMVLLRGLDGLTVEAWLPLIGAHQAVNAAIAVAAVQLFLGRGELDPATVRAGLATVEVPGRLELVRSCGDAEVVLDGAHDDLAMLALVRALRELPPAGRCVVVLGVGGGRDVARLIEPLRDLKATFVATRASAPTSMPAADVAAALEVAGIDAIVTPDVPGAVAVAQHHTGPGDRLVVTGSLHLAGDVRRLLTTAPAVAA